MSGGEVYSLSGGDVIYSGKQAWSQAPPPPASLSLVSHWVGCGGGVAGVGGGGGVEGREGAHDDMVCFKPMHSWAGAEQRHVPLDSMYSIYSVYRLTAHTRCTT